MIPVGILTAANASGLCPETVAFNARVVAAGGTLTTNEQTAVCTLVNSLKSAGIYSKFQIIYPMVGASAAACAQNLISSSFTGSFTGGWAYSSNGIQPNGSNTVMTTNFLCTTNMIAANWHQSFYSRTNFAGGAECGVGDVSGRPSSLMEIRSSGNTSTFSCGDLSNYGLQTTVTDSRGFFLGSILSSTDRKYYRNSTTILTNTTNITNLIYAGSIIIGAYLQNNITPAFYSSKQCAFYSIGRGLTTAEANSFYTAVQTFQTTLSRQV
jgi:hypothetical protein